MNNTDEKVDEIVLEAFGNIVKDANVEGFRVYLPDGGCFRITWKEYDDINNLRPKAGERKKMQPHTPLPYCVGPTRNVTNNTNGLPDTYVTDIFYGNLFLSYVFADNKGESKATAEFIVKACNLHEELVAIINSWKKHLEVNIPLTEDEEHKEYLKGFLDLTKQVLTEAEADNG